LLARTPLDEEAVRQLGEGLAELVQNVLEWGRRRGSSSLGSIHYRIEPDRLVLRVLDRGSWSSCGDLTHEHGLGLLIGGVRFDDLAYGEAGDEVILIRHY